MRVSEVHCPPKADQPWAETTRGLSSLFFLYTFLDHLVDDRPMQYGEYRDRSFLNLKNDAVITNAQLSIPRKRTAQRLAEYLRLTGEFIFNRASNPLTPLPRKGRNILRHHFLLVYNDKSQLHAPLCEIRLTPRRSRVRAIASSTASSSSSRARCSNCAAFVACGT